MSFTHVVQTEQPCSLESQGTTRNGDVTIRYLRDTPEDSDYASKEMIAAFEDKFAHAVTREKFPALRRVMASLFRNQHEQFYTRVLVAEVDGARVGFMMLKFKGDTYSHLFENGCDLGCWNLLRLLWSGWLSTPTMNNKGVCLLDGIGVDPSCRGRGVGKAMLDRADAEARKEGCKMIFLLVLTSNRAMRLYERHGYQRTGTKGGCCLRCAIGPPGAFYIMEKQL